MTALSQRLAALARWVPTGAAVADIGCDHGYLAAALARTGHKVIACDISAPSLEKARRLVAQEGLDVQLRLGSGLSVLLPGEVQCIVAAGMSAPTLLDILREGDAVAKAAGRVVLQPMQGADQLRLGLGELGWRLAAEDLVAEAGRFFPILVLEPGQAEPLTELQAHLGPHLLQQKHPELGPCIGRQLGSLHRQHARLLRRGEDGSKPRLRAIEEQCKTLEEVLQWLSE